MRIYLETSNTGRTGARSGIPTVVRGLAAGLVRTHDVQPVRWSFKGNCLTPLKDKWLANLDLSLCEKSGLPLSSLAKPAFWPVWARTFGVNYKAPIHLHPFYASQLKGNWLIMPELMQGDHIRLVAGYARRHGMRVAGIFHDAIPWLHPELVFHRKPGGHAEYMAAFAELDVVIADSDQSANDFRHFVQTKNLRSAPVVTCLLAAQIFGCERETQVHVKTGGTMKILYVSTLEPRKNHLLLLRAFEGACARPGGLDAELHLVGGAYPYAPEIGEKVLEATRRNPRIFWHEKVNRPQLGDFYRDCDFTVFASCIEGFGLPVMESMWFGRPCLCANESVMVENAREGGCLTINMRDQEAIADGLIKMATDPDLRRKLSEEVVCRKLKTWNEYADDVLNVLQSVRK